MPPFREEVLNVILADVLARRGLLTLPETIRRSVGRGRRLPDIMVADLWGVRTVIEGRTETGSAVQVSLLKDARARVQEGIAPICLAILYPPALRETESLRQLRRELARVTFKIRVVSEVDEGAWAPARLDDIAEALRRTYELLVTEDVVAVAAAEIHSAIEAASESLLAAPASPSRLQAILGIAEDESSPTRDKAEAQMRICRTTCLTLVNAMVFHQVLANRDARIPPIGRLADESNVGVALSKVWAYIIEAIDYIPIFTLALEIVRELSGNPGLDSALSRLAGAAVQITERRAALRHDLMGRIYHRLLADAKYFGAYYTMVPSATLLLKLALRPCREAVNWSRVDEVRAQRIGDLACGTGTLLKAALQTIVDNHIRKRAEEGIEPDLPGVHQALLEEVLWGFDVIPFAIHLAASALAMHEPDVPFAGMHLYTLPLGGGMPPALGSLSLLSSGRATVQADLFGAAHGPTRRSSTEVRDEQVTLGPLDLCVMNPPFTRSVGGNLLFGNLAPRERKRLQNELKRVVQREKVPATITAGLGGVFVALGHQYLREGGRLALVLPRALLSGVAWEETRCLIGAHYHVEYILVSHETNGWNFSENTSLSECMIVARKLRGREVAGPTKVVNMWERPGGSIQALAAAECIKSAEGAALDATAGVEELMLGGQKLGELLVCPAETVREGRWGEYTAFAQTDLCRVGSRLLEGTVLVPGRGEIGKIRMKPLSSLGVLGPDCRDIHDGFKATNSRTPYPALWGHETEAVREMALRPNKFLAALPRARTGRPLRDARLLLSRAGRLLIAERLRLTTARAVCVIVPKRVLSNTWWPVAISGAEGIDAKDIERILCLWLNSTLGILSLIGVRVDTEGAWVKLKKPILQRLSVLDPHSLGAEQISTLVRAYEDLSRQELLQLPEIDRDPVRARIDSTIAAVLLNGEELEPIRQLLCAEPILERRK